ncbi:unnamed protein product [Rangifer tarandus platyrhynchus]|uniref:Uncharacterized protein n=1 Tax=Rangifer tarandus platyrhynchus TaxID=3082113 RepID=A0ABN8YT10_RANTA|nr:unnamed protein product [Rangifer tarandus platyrhynchus]
MQPQDLELRTPRGRPLLAWRPLLESPGLHAEKMLGDRAAHMRQLQAPGYPRAFAPLGRDVAGRMRTGGGGACREQ